jgi:hypothetical protein
MCVCVCVCVTVCVCVCVCVFVYVCIYRKSSRAEARLADATVLSSISPVVSAQSLSGGIISVSDPTSSPCGSGAGAWCSDSRHKTKILKVSIFARSHYI